MRGRSGEQAARRLRILQVVQKPQRRGAEIFASQLSKHLRCAGHTVRTAYLYPHLGPNAIPLAGDDTVLGGRERHSFERLPGIHPSLLRRLHRLIEEIQPDIVQVNGGRAVKYGAAVASLQPTRSWALVYRNIGQPRDWMRGWRHAIYSRVVMPRMDGVVAISRNALKALEDMYELSAASTFIPCAVDPATVVPTVTREVIRRQTQTPGTAPVIVSVGSLTAEKRVDRLLRTAEAASRNIPDLHVWIVGEGPLRHTLEAQVRASGLASRVRFLGVHENVANYMNAGDVFALTSDTEGMPAVVLEAGLSGLAVVATRVGGVSECVLDGQTGILVERSDEDAFANALTDLLQQPERRCRLGSAAREWIARQFTMSRVAEQYAGFYQQLAAR